MADDEIKAPKVFISYSQDSPEHKDRVFALSNRLVKDGLHCNIDQYVDSPPEGWQRWMESQIQEADFVLVICTARYLRRVKGKEKPDVENGVRWESVIMYQALYEAGTLNTKFIPVLFEGASALDIPIPIKSATRYFLTTEADYKELYRRLTNQPLRRRPKTGELRRLPPREDNPDFLFSRSEPTLKNSQEPLITHSEDTSAPSEQTAFSEMQEKLQEYSHPGGNTLAPPVEERRSKTGMGQQSNTVSLVNKWYNNIIAAQPLARDAKKLFSRQKIYPDECERALSVLGTLNKQIQELDKLAEKHTHLFRESRSELVRTLHLIEVQLGNLEIIKSTFCPVCLEAPLEQRQDIQQKLKEIEISIRKITRLKKSFNKLASLSEDKGRE